MSTLSASRFYAAINVDSDFSQNIESLFNRFIEMQACRTGWHVDLQTCSPETFRATITDPEGIAKSYPISIGEQDAFSDHLLRRYQEYAARNCFAAGSDRQTKWQIWSGKGHIARLQRWRRLVRATLRPTVQ